MNKNDKPLKKNILAFLVLFALLSGCKQYDIAKDVAYEEKESSFGVAGSIVYEQPPVLEVIYYENGQETAAEIKARTYEWTIVSTDGTACTVSSDGISPFDDDNLTEISVVENEILLSFAYEPASYQVEYWSVNGEENDVENSEENSEENGVEEITSAADKDNKIKLSHKEENCIYEVHAFWKQGNAYYYFRVKN